MRPRRPACPLRPPVTVASAGDLTPAAAVTALPGGPVMAGKHAGHLSRGHAPQGLPPAGRTGRPPEPVYVATAGSICPLPPLTWPPPQLNVDFARCGRSALTCASSAWSRGRQFSLPGRRTGPAPEGAAADYGHERAVQRAKELVNQDQDEFPATIARDALDYPDRFRVCVSAPGCVRPWHWPGGAGPAGPGPAA
jgi:hypothetical protein